MVEQWQPCSRKEKNHHFFLFSLRESALAGSVLPQHGLHDPLEGGALADGAVQHDGL